MWVANAQSNSGSKFRVSDGANLGNFPLGHPAQLLAFDWRQHLGFGWRYLQDHENPRE